MSTLDINKVLSSLKSTKIKDRNDALTLLESLLVSKFTLNSKQFKALTQAILKLIDNEKSIYFNSNTGLVEVRLSRASSSLRILTEKSMNDSKIKLKYKNYLDLIMNIIEQFFYDSNILYPCSIDFTKILSSILNQHFFKEHLNYDDWIKIYNFLIKLINFNLKESSDFLHDTNNNEKLLIESYNCLQNLMQCNSLISINYLQLITNSNYFKLLDLLERTLEHYKKENFLIIIVFKILNKLIIILSTQDFKFVHKIIRMGIKLLISFYQTQWESLQIQFLIFLNLSSTHNFLVLDNLPKLIGDNGTILSEVTNVYENAELSMISSKTDRDISVQVSTTNEDNNEILLYNIGILIQNLLTRLNSTDFYIRSDDIGLIHSACSNKSWFCLNSIYLKSNHFKPWLLNIGLSKLIDSYYRLKHSVAHSFNNTAIFGPLNTGSILKGSNKRQKLDIISNSLYQANSILEFCNKLINDKTNYRVQQNGLQILVFYLENYKVDSRNNQGTILSEKFKQSVNVPDDESFDSNESTRLSGFGYPTSSDSHNGNFDKNIIIKSILSTFDNNNLNYWALLSCKSLLNNTVFYSESLSERIKSKYFIQLLKVTLQLLKHKDLSKITSNLAFLIIFSHTKDNLTRIIDKSIIAQLDNLVDLSEINGPYSICDESFQFWYSIHKVIKEINLPKKHILANRIQDWLLSKWNECFSVNTIELLDTNSGLPNFIAWLCGISITYVSTEALHNLYNGKLKEPYLFSNTYHALERFITMESTSNNENKEFLSIDIETLGENNSSELLLIKVMDNMKQYSSNDNNPILLFEWTILISNLSELLKDQSSFNHIVKSLEYQCSTALASYRNIALSSELSFKLIEIINKINFNFINQFSSLLEFNFPFEKFIFEIPLVLNTDFDCIASQSINFQPRRNYSDNKVFDDEFSQINQAPPSQDHQVFSVYLLNRINLDYEMVPCIEFMKFVIMNEKVHRKDNNAILISIISYFEKLKHQDLLYCYYYLTKLIESEEIALETISSSLLIKLIRILGDGPLINPNLDRNELTIIIVCKLLIHVLPLLMDSSDIGFKKDCYDICDWLLQCGSRNLILTEGSYTEFCKFLIILLKNDQTVFSNSHILDLLLNKFKNSINNIKISIVSSFVDFMKLSSITKQMSIYKELFMKFSDPEQSVETSATYSMFFCHLSKSSSHIMIAAIFNLLECSKFPFFLPYLRMSLNAFCDFMCLTNSRALFKLLKFEILRYWWKFDDINQFPFFLFGYTDKPKFYSENYKELLAIALSTNHSSTSIHDDFLKSLTSIKQLDIGSLVCDCFPLAIALAFTRESVRNKIFDILSSILKDRFRHELKEKIMIIVLEIIKHTDLSNERQLLDLYKDREISFRLIAEGSTHVLEPPSETWISLDSSLDLLQTLIRKYHPNYESFWSTKELYFLIRHISSSFGNSISIEQKILNIRKIKLLLILGSRNTLRFETIKLLIDHLSLLLKQPELRNDIYQFLIALPIQDFNQFGEESSLPLVVKLISQLVDIGFNEQTQYGNLLLNLEKYVRKLNRNKKVYPILIAAIKLLNLSNALLNASIIESFLDDEIEFNLFQSGGSSQYIIKLISQVFDSVQNFDEEGSRTHVVKVLLEANGKVFQTQSQKFSLWSAKYLSNYYLNGGIKRGISHIISLNELNDLTSENFDVNVNFMDNILDQILKYLKGDDIEIAACAETILGVLIWKYNTSKRDVLKFLNFEKYYEAYGGYIVPIDFHSCILLNSEDDSLDFFGDNLQEIIANLKSSLTCSSFDLWAKKLFLALIQEVAKFTSIAPLISSFVVKVTSFACEALPFFICFYINLKGKEGADRINELINEFIMLNWNNEDAVNLFTKIVLAIRIGAKKTLSSFNYLYQKIDLNTFYKLAAHNKLFKTSIMLFEDFYSETTDSVNWQDESKLLSYIYESIDDDDLIYGLPEETSLEYAMNMISRRGESSDQVKFNSGMFDADISLNSEMKNSSILHSMTKNGLMGVSRLVSKNVSDNCKSDDTYEWAWKLNCWELPIPRNALSEHEVIYKTLKQVHDYPTHCDELCKKSILEVLLNKDKIINNSLSSKEFRSNMITWLKTMASISSINDILRHRSTELVHLINMYSELTTWFELSDINLSESILLTRAAAFQLLANFPMGFSNFNKEDIWLCALHELIRYNNLSRISNESQKMVSSTIIINEISKLKFDSSDILFKRGVHNLSKYQAACTLWSQGQTSIPVVMLKDLQKNECMNLPIKSMNITSCLVNATLAGWMAESRQDLASNIMEKYVLPAADMVTTVQDLRQQSKVYQLFGRFCESQYKSRNLSDAISKLEKRVSAKKAEIEELKAHYGKTSVAADEKKTVQRYYSKLKMSYTSELADLDSMKKNKDSFSDKAVEFYLKCVSIDEDLDEDLDKFFSLWLERPNKDDLNRSIKNDLLSLPTYKLIGWCTQLISRITCEESEFQVLLQNLILNLCFDHPHHTLYNLMSLRIYESRANGNSTMVAKYTAANTLWQKFLNRKGNYVTNILMPIEMFCEESIKLAEYKVSRSKSLYLDKIGIGEYWMKELPHLPPPTKHLLVDYTTNYKSVPYLIKIESKITIASSGLSLPKIARFQLSNGELHKILLKHGTDDLRQDSIMEQVFEKVNNMFDKDKETRKRNLRIRTYKAIPLGPQAGIIEFVPNSVALIDVIKPYHLSKDKLTLDKARSLMRECQSGDKHERFKAYDKITGKIKPVLRYFFFNNFLIPEDWYNSRISFTHGIATTSMVGHILGLGDRHCNNILLDKTSGEPIHIDLGVAFDQGKRLPIPETVPFRLTRDIVDGFGITGVNGVFKQSCENTFRVLRDNKDHILAILDVLRWDPLYSWTLSPIRKKKLQNDTTEISKIKVEEDGSEAGRAISMVSDKLIAGGLSTEATVRELVQEATSPQNLALIYFGWCPFY